MIDWIKKSLIALYQQFVLINDSPQRIALGFGFGVFLGIMPFTGVLAAVAVAWALRLNKTAAILGSVTTNTWLGILVFGAALQTGSLLLGLKSSYIQEESQRIFKDFHFSNLFDIFTLKILGTIALGYLIVSALLGILAYGACLAILFWHKRLR